MAQPGDKPRHPPGLAVLFFTEMWERFGFYLMLGIFSLYMLEARRPGPFGGLGFDRGQAADIYGTYIALVYLTPFFGGILADRFIGYRRSIVMGGVLMAAGYIGLGLPSLPGLGWLPLLPSFYISLLLICLGNGLFKPNISTIVGKLYADDSPLKEAGYNIFYMGINIGAFVCNFVAAWLRNTYGWGYAFAAAGVGMIFGVLWFLAGQKKLAGTADKGEELGKQAGKVFGQLTVQLLVPAAVCGTLGYFFLGGLFDNNAQTAAFVAATIPIIVYYVVLWRRSPRLERPLIGSLLSIFAVVVVFWMIFHQNGSSLTYWARENTNREAGAAAGVLRAVDLAEDATIGTAVTNPDTVGSYWYNVAPAQRPAAGQPVTLVSTELFQSVNPFFIVLLTPLVVGFFGWLRRRHKEPSTPAKISWGMLITAFSTVPMIIAVLIAHQGTGVIPYAKVSPWWLVGTYGIITVGELFLSPMGLALVSKLAPQRVTAMMMGGWFLATAIGNKMAGVLAGFWDRIPLVWIFVINCAAAVLAAIVIAMLTPWIRGVMKDHIGKS